MRLLIISFLLFFGGVANCQDLISYQDSVYRFQIGVPTGWRYGKPNNYPTILFVTIRPPVDSTDKYVENGNVNIVPAPNSNLDSAFATMLKYNSQIDNFNLVSKGASIFERQDFRWVIFSDTNELTAQLMYTYVFLTYDGEKAYILTMTSTPKNFEKYKGLFQRIAQTFKVKKVQ